MSTVALLGAALALTWLDQTGESLMDAAPPAAVRSDPGPSVSAAAPAPEPAAPPDRDPEPSRPEPRPGAPPSFDVVRITPQGNAVIAGRAEPHSTVTVLDGGLPAWIASPVVIQGMRSLSATECRNSESTMGQAIGCISSSAGRFS